MEYSENGIFRKLNIQKNVMAIMAKSLIGIRILLVLGSGSVKSVTESSTQNIRPYQIIM